MISRTAHFIWLGSPVPKTYMAEVKNFRRLNPEWTIQWWHESDLAGLSLRNQDMFDAAPTLVPADSVYQLQSDIARYEILLAYGGVYLDTDYRWQKPLDTLLRPEDRLVTCWERQNLNVANGFIAAEAEHPVMTQAVEQTRTWCQRWGRRGLRANRLTGPAGLWTDLVRRDQRQVRSVRVLPQRLLHAVPWSHPEWADDFTFPDAVAVHLWGHQLGMRDG